MIVREDQLEAIASKSYINCHAMGLDSVLFTNEPGHRLRAFIANGHHSLYRNNLRLSYPMTIGLHPHHCNITLSRIYGDVNNIVQSIDRVDSTRRLAKFKYLSQIRDGRTGFIPTNEARNFSLRSDSVEDMYCMAAHELHTIHVPEFCGAAWWVLEGEEDPNYESICWSNVPLDIVDFSSLYRPMDIEYLRRKLDQLQVGVTSEKSPIVSNYAIPNIGTA